MYEILLAVQYISIVVLICEAAHIFMNWKSNVHGVLFFSCVATLINNLGYLVQMTSKSAEQYLSGTQMSYMGKVWIPLTLFLFVLQICNINYSRTLLRILAVLQMTVSLLVLTCKYHSIYYTTMEFKEDGMFPYVKYGHGFVHDAYNVVLVLYIIVGIFVLLKAIIKEKDSFVKKRMMCIFATILVESVSFFIYRTGATGYYDVTVLGYSVGAIFMGVAIFKYDLLDTLQLAKDYVIDEVSEGIIAINNSNVVEYYNQPAKKIFKEIESDKNMAVEIIQKSIKENVPINIGDRIYSAEERKLYQDERERGKVYVLVDDTEHYRYLEELKKQKEIAEAANESKSRFLSVVSHEIRTPMNAVIGMTELLLRGDLTEEQRKYMLNIKNSGSALVMIINDILDQSKIEAGKMEIVEDSYDIRELVNDVKLIIENRIGDKSLELKVDIDDKLPNTLVGDALRIRQIIINLLNNAVKFTEEGYVKLTAKIVSETENGFDIRFSIKDTGQGIKKEDLEKLGQAFAQVDTKKNHNKEGTGLGLSISKDFIKLMGGELKVDSVYGEGTEFYFVINQKKGLDKENMGESELKDLEGVVKEFTAPEAKILVVDDTDINLMITKEILKPLDMTIETVNSGTNAIEMVKEKEYHLIFMDYMMPELNGAETTAEIRKLAAVDEAKATYYKEIPIIALTGDMSDETQKVFEEAGINGFTEKPVEVSKLKEILYKWLPKELIKM